MRILPLSFFAALVLVVGFRADAADRADGAAIYVLAYEPGVGVDDVTPGKAWNALSREAKALRLFSLAVDDFNYHHEKMRGFALPVRVVAGPEGIGGSGVVLGPLALAAAKDFAVASASEEAFRLRTADERIWAGGPSHFGSALAVYALLQRLGCDWVFPGPGGEVIPARDDLRLPDFDAESAPSFALRAPWMNLRRLPEADGRDFRRWVLRQKGQLDQELFDPLKMRGGHVWQAVIKKYRDRFDANPDMYALMRKPDGAARREGPQLETTHPEVLTLMVEYIRDEFRRYGWPNDQLVCIGVGPADGSRLSSSPETLARLSGRVDPMGGLPDVTDLVVDFANTLLEMTTEEFPNLHLGFYLYSTHAGFPVRQKPHPRLSVTIADINFSRLHGLGDPASKTRHAYRRILEQWKALAAEQGNPFFFRGFDYNMAECFLPYTKLKIWGEDIPYYHAMGVRGMYNNWSATWSISAPSNYLDINLEWDAAGDWRALLAEFCRKAYGDGAPDMEAYYLDLATRQSEAGYEAGSFHSFPLMYDSAWVDRADARLAAALTRAGSEAERERIRVAREPLAYLRLFLAYDRDMKAFRFEEAKRGFDALVARMTENAAARPLFFEPPRYPERFLRATVDAAASCAAPPNRLLLPVPERLKMGLDPDDTGLELGLFREAVNDAAWPEYATHSTTWDAQGLWGLRSGSVWYRWRFDAPALGDGEHPALMLLGVDNIADVWLNDRYLGRGRGFLQPLAFDLTDTLRPGEKNFMAIRVQRFGNSELGTGGILYPAFLFAGPRLKASAPTGTELHEILPGAGGQTPVPAKP